MDQNDIRMIPLSNGGMVIVDASDFGWLNRFTWRLGTNGYPERSINNKGNPKRILMHREILGLTDGTIHTDHINGNRLDNRRSNLRTCTKKQNCQNRGKRKDGKSSIYKGVTRNQKSGSYYAAIEVENRKHHLGSFTNEVDAAKAYDQAAIRFHGQFARLNFPQEGTA